MEVLAGDTTPTEAARLLGVSTPRYYSLELRAINGLVSACEPRPKGRVVSPDKVLEKLEKENARLKQETSRLQALLRVSQKVVGLPEKRSSASGNGKRIRRSGPRARKVVAMLRKASIPEKVLQPTK